MAKKRNVDAESHLLTGGLLTGFLTFMGFIPGAAITAAITGSAVMKDIKKAKTEEVFEQDFKVYQQIMVDVDEHWREIEKLIDEFKLFSPDSPSYLVQLKLENLFKDGKIIDYCEKNVKYKSVKLKDLIQEAQEVEDKDKILVLSNGRPWEYVVLSKDEYIGCFERGQYLFQFKEKCNKAGIPFKSYGYAELYKLKEKMKYQFYEPYRFDFTKYH